MQATKGGVGFYRGHKFDDMYMFVCEKKIIKDNCRGLYWNILVQPILGIFDHKELYFNFLRFWFCDNSPIPLR